MSLADGQFSSAIRDTLAETAIDKVNFRAGGLMIGTMHLRLIAALITNGMISCKIDPSKVTTGAAAVYDPNSKTIFGLKANAFYADEKQSFVHECTHAYIHFMGWAHVVPSPFRVKILKNEVAAYLAGNIYVFASGQQVSTSGADPNTAAYNIVKNKGLGSVTTTGSVSTNAGSPIDFSDTELAPLFTAIKGSPLYQNWNTNEDMN